VANITDTQTATFEYVDLRIVWTHRTWGDPPDAKYPWGAQPQKQFRNVGAEPWPGDDQDRRRPAVYAR
jgi:hypothetical protein